MRSKKCWESATSIATVFNRAWQVTTQNHLNAKVPESLPDSSSFICSDAQTVLAFILCTAGDDRGCMWWQPDGLTFDDTRVVVATIGADTVAHVEGPFRDERQSLTKHELERVLVGWPPWYRESFQTRSGVTVPFPIASNGDIPRAGWILAVGLMDFNQASQRPLALWRSPSEPTEPGLGQNGVMFRQAIRRCRDHISENLFPRFPDNHLFTEAHNALVHLIRRGTISGMHGLELWASRTGHLSYSQCQLVFRNFNDYTVLTDTDKIMLEPILSKTLAAAVTGACEVVRYLQFEARELKIPPELQPFHREVWLRNCTTRLPIK